MSLMYFLLSKYKGISWGQTLEHYGDYQAGSDMETKPPMLTFTTDDCEASIVWDRSKDGGNE